MSLQNLTRFPRLEFIGAPTPLEYLPPMRCVRALIR